LVPILEDYDSILKSLTGEAVIAKPINEAEYNALPSGTTYIHPDGDKRVKP
jgi:hypothetical protein